MKLIQAVINLGNSNISEMDIESQSAVEALGILDHVNKVGVIKMESSPAFLVSQGIGKEAADSYFEIWQVTRGE